MQPALRIEVGDAMPDFQLLDVTGTYRSLLSLALGKPLVVICCPDGDSAPGRQLLEGFAADYARLADAAIVFAVTGQSADENARLAAGMGLPFVLLSDPEHWVLSLYDARRRPLDAEARTPGGCPACVLADANRRVVRIDPCVTAPGLAEEVAAVIASLPQPSVREIGRQAPVLMVPEVLDLAFCDRLMALHETGGSEPTGVTRGDHRGRGEVIDQDSKVRRDHLVRDAATNQALRALLTKRVLPEVAKVFDFQPKRGEQFKIGCYEASEGGFFEPHRDNVDPTGGRRFAMSLILNSGDFEGGQMRFPEYGPELYNPTAGGALVFSCRLVHEVAPVTAGRRFALLTFFH